MDKFHINYNGEARPCEASVQTCRYGGESSHYPTAEAARTAYELSMAGSEFQTTRKEKDAADREWLAEASGYEEVRKEAEIVLSPSAFRDNTRKLDKVLADVEPGTPVAIRFKDSHTVIYGGAGNNYTDEANEKNPRLAKKKKFSRFGHLTVKGLRYAIPADAVEEVAVFRKDYKFPETPARSMDMSEERLFWRSETPAGTVEIVSADKSELTPGVAVDSGVKKG